MNQKTTTALQAAEAAGKIDLLEVLKELIVDIALNQSEYRLSLVVSPINYRNTPTAFGVSLKMVVEAEVLPPVHRMAKLDAMRESFRHRSIAIRQDDENTLEITYYLSYPDEDAGVDQEEVIYDIKETTSHRQIELASRDMLEFFLHGTVKGNALGED